MGYSLLYLSERERFPLLELQWRTPPGVQFSLDDQVPPGSSQHQKIVAVDDSVAFSGGLDITGHRWDTPTHELNNPWRIDTAGRPYRPFHDVQAMVDAPRLGRLAEIVRERWLCATGQKLPAADAQDDVWPKEVNPDLTDVRVGIARTQPALNSAGEVREVERLFLDFIDAAEHSIYIENQFFTSSLVAERLARRLRERPHLEVLLIGPQHYDSWLNPAPCAMGASASCASWRRREQPIGCACSILTSEGKTATDTMVHSKVMIVDDRLLRVGSANANNRSMGTDTECDLAVEAVNDRQPRRSPVFATGCLPTIAVRMLRRSPTASRRAWVFCRWLRRSRAADAASAPSMMASRIPARWPTTWNTSPTPSARSGRTHSQPSSCGGVRRGRPSQH